MATYEEELKRILEEYDQKCRDSSMAFKELNWYAQKIQKLLEEFTKKTGKEPRDL